MFGTELRPLRPKSLGILLWSDCKYRVHLRRNELNFTKEKNKPELNLKVLNRMSMKTNKDKLKCNQAQINGKYSTSQYWSGTRGH